MYAPSVKSFVVPGSCVILALLFAVQRFGTQKVGLIFAPVTCLWLAFLFGIGVYRILEYPQIFRALNPACIIEYTQNVGFHSLFKALGSAMLAITGVEALYADLGHFRAGPIRASWLGFAFPALIIQYLG